MGKTIEEENKLLEIVHKNIAAAFESFPKAGTLCWHTVAWLVAEVPDLEVVDALTNNLLRRKDNSRCNSDLIGPSSGP